MPNQLINAWRGSKDICRFRCSSILASDMLEGENCTGKKQKPGQRGASNVILGLDDRGQAKGERDGPCIYNYAGE